MNFDETRWLQSYPADEIVMTQVTLNRLNTALAESTIPGTGVVYQITHDENMRQVREPAFFGDKRVRVRPAEAGDLHGDWIQLRKSGRTCATLFLPYEPTTIRPI